MSDFTSSSRKSLCLAACGALALGALGLARGTAVDEAAAASVPSLTASDAAAGRVVLLGFDGADARTMRALVAEDPDQYPNFARLAAEGSFEPLEVVAPPARTRNPGDARCRDR